MFLSMATRVQRWRSDVLLECARNGGAERGWVGERLGKGCGVLWSVAWREEEAREGLEASRREDVASACSELPRSSLPRLR